MKYLFVLLIAIGTVVFLANAQVPDSLTQDQESQISDNVVVFDDELAWLVSFPAIIITALLGMFIHFLKKDVKGETVTEIAFYFRDHVKSTLIAIISTLIGVVAYYATLSTGQAADIIVAFGIGFMFDSVFNKWEASTK